MAVNATPQYKKAEEEYRRAQSVQEIRGEIRLLARTIAALAEEGRS